MAADDPPVPKHPPKAQHRRRRRLVHDIVDMDPENNIGYRGPDPGIEPSLEFPCRSWKLPQGRGTIGSIEHQVEMACHAASRAWAAAEDEGQDAVDQLCDTTVKLAIADKAIELNYWASDRRQYDNCVPKDMQEWRAGLPALVQQAYGLACTKRTTLPALQDIEAEIVAAVELHYTRYEDALSL